MVFVDDPGHRDVPPPIDLAGHIRDLGRVLLPAFVVGVLVAAAVFGLRSSLVDKEYSATVITQVTPSGEVVAGDAFVEQLRAPFMSLAEDDNVLKQVLTQVDTGWDAATLRSHLTLSPGTSPALLAFTVSASSPQLAQQIARATVTTVAQAAFSNRARDVGRQVDELQATIAAEQTRNATLAARSSARALSDARISELQTQLSTLQSGSANTLGVLSSPEPSSSPIAPKPLPESLVAGLVAFILAAELFVLLRSRVGRRPNRMWARRVAHKNGARLTVDDGVHTVPPLLISTLAQRHRRGRAALVLLGSGTSFPAPVTESGPQIIRAPLASEWWADADLSDLVLAVVVVSTKSSDRALAEQGLQQLKDLGGPRHLLLQKPRSGTPTTPSDAPDRHGGDEHTARVDRTGQETHVR